MRLFGLHRNIYRAARINGYVPSEKVLFRQKQLRLFEELLAHGTHSLQAAKLLGQSRASLFRWKKLFQAKGLAALEPKSTRPKHLRKPKWSHKLIKKIIELKRTYPAWGKDKLKILLAREGIIVSESTVGRIISYALKRGYLKSFVRKKINWKKRSIQHRYATRKPKDYKAQKPGDIIQVDTMHLELGNGKKVKQFTAYCPVSRWSVVDVYPNASSRNAALFLEKILLEMPFFVNGIQIDGGSEFMGEFEEACRGHQLKLYVLPPRSPKLNGAVERSNGTWRYEFYWVYDLSWEIQELRQQVSRWQHIYNYIRPHQALKGKTPYENMMKDEA